MIQLFALFAACNSNSPAADDSATDSSGGIDAPEPVADCPLASTQCDGPVAGDWTTSCAQPYAAEGDGAGTDTGANFRITAYDVVGTFQVAEEADGSWEADPGIFTVMSSYYIWYTPDELAALSPPPASCEDLNGFGVNNFASTADGGCAGTMDDEMALEFPVLTPAGDGNWVFGTPGAMGKAQTYEVCASASAVELRGIAVTQVDASGNEVADPEWEGPYVFTFSL